MSFLDQFLEASEDGLDPSLIEICACQNFELKTFYQQEAITLHSLFSYAKVLNLAFPVH